MKSLVVAMLFGLLAACQGVPEVTLTCAAFDPSKDTYGLRVDNEFTHCTFVGDDLTIRFEVVAPAGAELRLDGTPWPREDGKYTLRLAPYLLASPARDVVHPELQIPLSAALVTGEDVTALPLAVSIDLPYVVVRRLVDPIAAGHALPPTRTPRAQPPTVLVAAGHRTSLIGEPAKLGDVDLIALLDEHLDASRECQYGDMYRKVRHEKHIARVYTDTYTVYDARTGEQLAKRTFPPTGALFECPLDLNSHGGKGRIALQQHLVQRASERDVAAWLEQVRTQAP